MAKNIVVCCDGTGNEIDDHHSNVLKLYRVLKKNRNQLVYYDPGLGTMGASSDWARLKQNVEMIAGLALGYGLDRNILDAYRFLVSHYNENDRIFLFGFSRGAYTVRALAGFINAIGLLSPAQINLAGYALVAYKQVTEQGSFSSVRLYERTLRPRRPPIRFLGLWDTVSSIIVPRKDRMFLPSLRKLAYTASNPSVESIRHALAIDERRRMFRPLMWREDQPYWGGPFESPDSKPQDLKQIWFPGVHADIGGGYKEADSGLAKITLQWMIEEMPGELEIVKQSYNQIVLGKARSGSKQVYSEPSPTAKMHESLTRWWKALEYIPKSTTYQEWPARKAFFNCYIPNAEPRFIADEASIHPATQARLADDTLNYQPLNLP